MDNANERTSRHQSVSSSGSGHYPLHGRPRQSAFTKKLIPGVFIGIISTTVAISFILSIVRSVQKSSVILLLGVVLVGLLVVQIMMVMLARTGGIPRQKTWFVYLVGLCVVIECILTNVVIFG